MWIPNSSRCRRGCTCRPAPSFLFGLAAGHGRGLAFGRSEIRVGTGLSPRSYCWETRNWSFMQVWGPLSMRKQEKSAFSRMVLIFEACRDWASKWRRDIRWIVNHQSFAPPPLSSSSSTSTLGTITTSLATLESVLGLGVDAASSPLSLTSSTAICPITETRSSIDLVENTSVPVHVSGRFVGTSFESFGLRVAHLSLRSAAT